MYIELIIINLVIFNHKIGTKHKPHVYLSNYLSNNKSHKHKEYKYYMNPPENNNISNSNSVPEASLDPLIATTETVPTPVVAQKKSYKKQIIILSLIVAAIIGASIGYYLFAMKSVATPVTATTQTTTAADPSVEALTKSLTDNSVSETTLTNTDDSTQATDTSTSAANVGDSVDENNF
jgi:hypothetical protein